MRSSKLLATGLGVVAIAVAWGVAVAYPSPARLDQVGVEVSIGPSDPARSIYECTAVLTDLGTRRVLSSPKVLFRAGDDAQVRSGTQPGHEVLITVSVNAEETVARYEALIYRDGEVVSSQNVKVALAG